MIVSSLQPCWGQKENLFLRITSGLIAFYRNVYVSGISLINFLSLCLCVVLAITAGKHQHPHPPSRCRWHDGSVIQLEWLKLHYWHDRMHDTFTSDLAGGFWMFHFLSFTFFHSHNMKPILLKQRELRKYFQWRVLKPLLPLPDFSLCTDL